MTDVLVDRRRERDELIELVRRYAERLGKRLPVRAVVVVGSVARGDFNAWSDVDVVVVADRLPPRAPDRAGLLLADALPRIQPVGYTPTEFSDARARGNPLVREALELGVTVAGTLPP